MSDDWILMEVTEVLREAFVYTRLRVMPAIENAQFDFRPGHYVKVLAPESGREMYLALASEPEEKRFLEFLIKDDDAHPHELSRLHMGDRIKVSRPMGPGYPIDRFKNKQVLLVAIGSGIAPIRSALRSMLRRPESYPAITLLYGIQSERHLPCREDFLSWVREINLVICFSDQPAEHWRGEHFFGLVPQKIHDLKLGGAEMMCCVCGTKPFEEEMTRILQELKVPRENIHFNF